MPILEKNTLLLDFDSRHPSGTPFARSLALLLETTTRSADADAAQLYEYVEESRTLRLLVRAGLTARRLESVRVEISQTASDWLRTLEAVEIIDGAGADPRVGNFPEVILHRLHSLAVAPLRVGERLIGVLSVGWQRQQSPNYALALEPIATAATALLARARQSAIAQDLISRIAQVEAELADLKIAERTGGLLATGAMSSTLPATVVDHVQRVLHATDTSAVLAKQLADLRIQLHDRRLLARAKALLQTTRRMTEEQAYTYLRTTSRRQRRPLREVASELLAQPAVRE